MELEPGGAGEIVHHPLQSGSTELGRRSALLADQEYGAVPFSRSAAYTAACDVGVAACDAMHEPERFEERERAVDLGGGGSAPLPVEPFHDLVGAERPVAGEQELEDRPPIFGEAFPPGTAGFFGTGEALCDTGGMIMPTGGKG